MTDTNFGSGSSGSASNVKSDKRGAGSDVVSEAVGKVVSDAAEHLNDPEVKARVSEVVSGAVKEVASDTVSGMVSGAADRLGEQAEHVKAGGVEVVTSLAHVVRDAAGQIEARSPRMANMVRSAADSVERWSNRVGDRNPSEIVNAVTDFTRRRPAVALSCGILAGVLLARAFGHRSED